MRSVRLLLAVYALGTTALYSSSKTDLNDIRGIDLSLYELTHDENAQTVTFVRKNSGWFTRTFCAKQLCIKLSPGDALDISLRNGKNCFFKEILKKYEQCGGIVTLEQALSIQLGGFAAVEDKRHHNLVFGSAFALASGLCGSLAYCYNKGYLLRTYTNVWGGVIGRDDGSELARDATFSALGFAYVSMAFFVEDFYCKKIQKKLIDAMKDVMLNFHLPVADKKCAAEIIKALYTVFSKEDHSILDKKLSELA